MTKKKPVQIHESEQLQEIDNDLDSAVENLVASNRNVTELLESMEETEESIDEETPSVDEPIAPRQED